MMRVTSGYLIRRNKNQTDFARKGQVMHMGSYHYWKEGALLSVAGLCCKVGPVLREGVDGSASSPIKEYYAWLSSLTVYSIEIVPDTPEAERGQQCWLLETLEGFW
jgi:hypothetical protein